MSGDFFERENVLKKRQKKAARIFFFCFFKKNHHILKKKFYYSEIAAYFDRYKNRIQKYAAKKSTEQKGIRSKK
ncbi:hypothetical protein [Sapientia aquatica]|uniref:hypothetical protein n=1 Tax=Sapientia aquatica TaxID=1549640 RepID=UPI001059D7EF|nr:hypothetical protein [Sapientia aquatica]